MIHTVPRTANYLRFSAILVSGSYAPVVLMPRRIRYVLLLARQSHWAPRSVMVLVLLLVGIVRVHFMYLNPKICISVRGLGRIIFLVFVLVDTKWVHILLVTE